MSDEKPPMPEMPPMPPMPPMEAPPAPPGMPPMDAPPAPPGMPPMDAPPAPPGMPEMPPMPPMDVPPEMPPMPPMPEMPPMPPMDAPPEMPPMPEMPQVSLPIVPSRGEKQGIVKFFNYAKGYGFIEGEGEDLPFVYISEVTGEITEGDTVSFDDSIGPKGRVAMNVSLINKRDISCPICSTEDDGFSSACSACGFAL